MNQVNPDVSLNISPQVIQAAAEQGTLENVKSVKQSGDALVVVTNDGHQVTVTGEEPIALDAPSKKAQSDLSQLSATVNQTVEPQKDSQATFNMSMILNILFELQENAAQSATLTTLTNMFASLAETKSSISDLKSSAMSQLVGGLFSGAVTMTVNIGGIAGEGKAVYDASNQTVVETVSPESVTPETTPELSNAEMGMNVEDTELTDFSASKVEVDDAAVSKNAEAPKETVRKARVSDKEFQQKYNQVSSISRYLVQAGDAGGKMGQSVTQSQATLKQADAKGHDAIAKMYDTYASTENQNRSQIMSMLSSLISLIQSAGDSQNQTMGAIGQGMA